MKNRLFRFLRVFVLILPLIISGVSLNPASVSASGLCSIVDPPYVEIIIDGVTYTSNSVINITAGTILSFKVKTFAEPGSANTISTNGTILNPVPPSASYPPGLNFYYPGPSGSLGGGRSYTTGPIITNKQIRVIILDQNCQPDPDIYDSSLLPNIVINLVVPPPTYPDLTAAAPSPAIATTGVARTYTSNISNTGAGGTGGSFSNFFQKASAANGGGTLTDLTSTTMTTLAAGASGTATSPLTTFSPAGTYSIRACADKTDRNAGGVITESDETNNCGNWTNVVVTDPVSTDPDLTAAAPSPAIATTGVARTYTSNISNTGAGGTGGSFSNFFQKASAANGGGTLTDLTSTTMTTLAAGASGTATSPLTTFSPAGTYSIRACADKTDRNAGGVITESDETNNCGNWTNVVVTDPVSTDPDLTAAAPSPAIATTGVARTYTSNISNTGAGGTGGSFSNFFQKASAANGGGTLTDLTSTTMTTLAAGASGTATSPLTTFSPAGTYSIRACADKTDRNAGGVITESDETNNCGNWTNVVVTDPVAVTYTVTAITNPISGAHGTISPSSRTVVTGNFTTFTVTPDFGYTASASGCGGSLSGTTYTTSAINADCTVTASFTIVVVGSCVINLTASPLSIYTGASSRLTWDYSFCPNPNSCTSTPIIPPGISGFTNGFSIMPSPGLKVSPVSTTKYKITCGADSKEVTVTVKKKPIYVED